MIDELVLLEEDVQNQTRRFPVAAFKDFVELVVRRVGEEICRTGFFLQRSLDRLFAGNGYRVLADGVKEVDALTGGQNLFDPRQAQKFWNHRTPDRVFVVPQKTFIL